MVGVFIINVMMRKKVVLFICVLFYTTVSFSQTDTATSHGTIKVVKAKPSEIYIKVVPNFNKYNLTKIKNDVARNEMYQPFPVLDAYPYPFNYNAYFNNCFRFKEIDLKGKNADTVVVEVVVLANGKTYIKDKSPSILIKGVPATYDAKNDAYELNNLHLNCLNFLKQIKTWFPGYVVFPKKDKYRGQTVIKPDKKNVDVSGTVTIYFSTTPFEN